MPRLIIKIELAHVGANKADRLEPLRSAVFEYADEREALFIYDMLTTRDCTTDEVDVCSN